jgi:hypothetical protein
MKSAIALILTAALGAGNALAQGGPPAGKPGMAMMDMDKQSAQMQERMKTMQVQMDRIHKTTDPAERRKLMQEHMQSMREGMGMMKGMGGGMGAGMMGGDPKQRQDMMERRMDMMHMMMEQMMQHQQMSSPPAAK